MKKRRPSVAAFCVSCGWDGMVWNSNQNCPRQPKRAIVRRFGKHVVRYHEIHLLIYKIDAWDEPMQVSSLAIIATDVRPRAKGSQPAS